MPRGRRFFVANDIGLYNPLDGKPTRNQWARFVDMRMERKLLLVFLPLITLPLTFIGAVSYSR